MSGKVGVAHPITFGVLDEGDGSPRTGLTTGDFVITIRNPQNNTSQGTPVAVVEIGGGQYRFVIDAAFTTTHGAGEYGWTVDLTTAPLGQITGQVSFFVIADVGDSDLFAYQAKVWFFDANVANVDRYAVAWYKNGEPILAGVTFPLIQVLDLSDGSDLIASVAMVAVGATGYFRHDETSGRVVSGNAYMAQVKATIDSAVRTWSQPVGRDS